MKQKLLWLLFAIMVIINPLAKVAAQTSASGQLSFSVPGTFSACNTDTVCVKVYNNKSVKGVTYTGPVKLEVTIPGGALMVYKGVTAVTAANTAVTNVVYTAGTGKLTADVALPALGAFTEVCFLVQPDCNIGTLTPLPVFTAQANYPSGYPDGTQNVVAATANVGKGIISATAPIYPSLIHFNTPAAIGAQFPDVIGITNTGYGDIIEVIHTMVIPAKFTFNSYYRWALPNTVAGNFGPGINVAPFSNIILPDGSREIKIKLSGSLLGSDNVFSPNEQFNIGAYIVSKPPVECGQWQIKHTVEYNCGTGKPSCEPPVTLISTRTLRDDFPKPVSTLIVEDKVDGCNDAKRYEFDYKNDGTAVGTVTPTNQYPNVLGVAYDVVIGANFGGSVKITNLTANGVAINPLDAKLISGPSLNGITIFEISFKDINTNPAYGLIDVDGDGFLDDMPVGTNIPIKMLYSTDLLLSCAGIDYNIYDFMRYKDICRTEKTIYGTLRDVFGFEKKSAVTQTSVNNFGTLSGSSSDPTAPQTATFDFNFQARGSLTLGATASAKLKIRQSEKMEVDLTSVKLNGTTLSLTPTTGVQGAGATIGTQPGGNPTGAINTTTTDRDSLLTFDIPAGLLASLVDGVADNLEYKVVAYNCIIRQETKSSDSWSLCLKFKECGAAGGGEIDLSCKKPFSYSINRGCGVKPCYVNNADLYRIGPKGYISTAEMANIAPYDSLRSYECDTLMYAVSTYLNGDWPAGEANGTYTAQGFPMADGILGFTINYPTNAANIAAGIKPLKFIENESKIIVWNIDPVTKAKLSIAKTVSVQANDFGTIGGNNVSGYNQLDGNRPDYNNIAYTPATAASICADGAFWAYLCSKGTIGSYAYGANGSMHSSQTLILDDKSYAATFYFLQAGKALYDEGFTTKIWNDDNYLVEYKLKWKPRDDANWKALEDVSFSYGYQIHYGNYYNYNAYGTDGGNITDSESQVSSYFGSCGVTNKTTLIAPKDLTVENPNAVYQTDCGTTVCNKLYFDSFGGNYFRVGEVRVPYKLNNIKVVIPAGFSIDPTSLSYKVHTAGTVTTYTTGITNSATTGAITFAYTGGDFPRMDDETGKNTAFEFCYKIIDDNAAIIKENKKITTVFNLTEEGGAAYVLKDSALVSNKIPDLRIASLSPVIRNSDGGTCQPASFDFMLYNESDTDANFVHVAVDKSATVTPIVSITDMVGAIDSVKAYTAGPGGLIAYIGKLAARDSVRITIKGTTTVCTGDFKVLLDWNCAYPALATSDIAGLSAASDHEDIANATYDAADPKMLSRPVTNTVLKIEDLCGTKDVEFEVRNADLPNLFKLNGKFTLPSGMSFVAGSMTMTQPNGTVATPQAVTPTVAGQVVTADFSALAPFNTACGLTGSDTTAKNNVLIKFKIEFGSCPGGLSQELIFEGTAENYCGKTAKTMSILPIVYVGTGGNTNTYKVSSLSQTFKICAAKNEKQPLTETLTVTNLGGGGAPSTTVAGIDSVTVTMPFNSAQMLANNFVLLAPNAAVPITINAAGNPTFKVAVPAGVPVGGTFPIGITFDLTPLVDKLCEVATTPPFCFFSEFTSRVPLVCVAKNLDCTKSMPVLSKGAELVTKTFECCYVSIGSTVFEDKANNGIQDGTDPGIPGLLVTLYKGDGTTVVATTTTGADGKYLFDELFKGDYVVGVTPSAAVPNSSTLTVTADNQTDKDDNGTQLAPTLVSPTPEAKSGIITLTPDAEPFGAQETDANAAQDDALAFGGDKSGDMTVDFGFFTPYSVGSVAFIDADNDGIKDAGEAGIPGLLVTLYGADGTTVVATTTTGADGSYVFNNLPEGTYSVAMQPNTTQTLASSPVNTGDDNNKGVQTVLGQPSKSAPFTLGAGLQPTGEAGTGAGLSTSTDANTNSTLDFGFLAPMSIGSTAFNDLNNNGIQDPTEPGIPGLVVNLYTGVSPTGAAIATTTTDANGNYIFENLSPGDYIVGVLPDATAPKTSTGGTLGTDNQLDADNNGTQPGGALTEARSGVITLALNTEPDATTETATGVGGAQDNGTLTDPNGDMTVDFGFFTPYSIGSNVFVDKDNDGIKDAGEAGIPGLLVTLFAADGTTVVATTTTSADGSYVFNDLGQGTYTVGVTPNATQSLASSPTPGGDDANKGTQPNVGDMSKSAPVTLGPTLQPTGETGAGTGLSTSTDANTNSTLDFGFLAPMSIGSTAFNDKDNDGVQDAGEAGIKDLPVTLYAADGTTVVATTTTDSNGDYIFTNLPTGSYVVGIKPNATQPTSSTPASDTDSQVDGNDNGTQGASGTEAKSSVIVLALNDEPIGAAENAPTGGTQDDGTASEDKNGDMTVDFGFFTPYSIGSNVFVDKDNDGVKDAGEPGIPGLEVTLYKADGTTVVATTTTAADGSYVFNNLGEGDYKVGVKPNTTQTLASTSTSSGDDANKGTQPAVAAESISSVVTLGPGSQPTGETGAGTGLTTSLDENTNSQLDFGFLAPMSLGSTAFNDKNNDGIQAASGEPGIAGLPVTLYAADGTTVVATTTTDSNGDYIFKNLEPGSYVVGIKPNATQPTSSTPPADGDTSTDGNDNGTQPSQGAEAKSSVIMLALGTESNMEGAQGGTQDDGALTDKNGDMTVDFGFFTPYSIGSNVFVDKDNDGVKDAGEPGIPGLEVTLYAADGTTVVATTTTAADGSYVFNNLGEGTFVVGVKPNTTQTLASTSTPGGDDANAGTQPAIADESKSAPVTTGPGLQPVGETGAGTGLTTSKDENTNSTIDFGFLAPMSIGSNVFNDKNNDGIQGAGEPGLVGLAVTLYAADGTTVVATTTTDGNGDYIFKNLEPGSYVVGVTPNATQPTSSTTPTDGDTAIDSNDNGTQPVLTSPSDIKEAKSGVIVLTLNGETTTEPGSGGAQDDGAKTDPNGDMTKDFGFFTPYSIGSAVFNDADNDGIQGPGEAGIPGLLVTLFAADGVTVVATTTTGADGSYVFNNLGEGTFTVGVTPSAGIPNASQPVDPSGPTADSDNNGAQAAGPGTISKSKPIVLGPGLQQTGETGTGTGLTTSKDENTNSGVDFGFYIPLSIGSTVFTDTNNNGMQDAGEPGIVGAIVNLYKADGTTLVATTTTGADGKYIFNNLGQGSYVVGVTPVGPETVSSDDIATTAGDNQTDGDDNGVQTVVGGESKSFPIALKAGAEPTDATGTEASSNGTLDNAKDADGDMTIDFGFFIPAKLSNLVFLDVNKDGKQDPATEPGIGGVTVKLYDGEGNLVHTTVTDPNGEYIFENLRPGIPYTVKFTVPAGYTVSPSNVGGDDAIDSDGGPAVGGISSTGTYILSSGEDNKTADLGLFKTGALPLNLISFTAERASTQVNLTWKTANEVDFSHFEVQRSTNAKEFNSIGKVNGSNDKFYTLADANPVVGNNYYRLKMVDKNGTYTVSKIQVVNFEASTEFLTVENPAANGVINLTTNVENAKFNLASINGTTVSISTTHLGGDKYVVRVKNAAAGVYLINVTGDKSVITKKVILD